MFSVSTDSPPVKDVPELNMKNLFLMFIALITGGRIQTLPSGRVRIVFKWQYLLISLLAALAGTFILMNTTLFSWNNIDQSDEETIFAPFTSRKDVSKWRNYITNQVNSQPETHPKRTV